MSQPSVSSRELETNNNLWTSMLRKWPRNFKGHTLISFILLEEQKLVFDVGLEGYVDDLWMKMFWGRTGWINQT